MEICEHSCDDIAMRYVTRYILFASFVISKFELDKHKACMLDNRSEILSGLLKSQLNTVYVKPCHSTFKHAITQRNG